MTVPLALRPLLVLSGTTASAKNATGVVLAERLHGEILVLDSMKVYRGMDLGTDKPGPELAARVPHHLLDLLPPHASMNLHRYVSRAAECADEVLSRGRLPIVVGGTALYLQGLLFGVLEGAPPSPEFRRAFAERVAREGLEAQHGRLWQVDPPAAERIHANDRQRIERALEVFETTGRPISERQSQWNGPARRPHELFVLTWPREELARRIDRRVEAMFDGGLLEETRRILEGEGFSEQARAAIGYREAIQHLRGEIDREEAIRRAQSATRRFARKQLTWLKKHPAAHWIEGMGGETPTDLAERILAIWG